MIVHFICRGNAFRSLIAEAYLNSLGLEGVETISSGTVANEYREANRVNFAKTQALLRKHGIEGWAKTHYADQLTSARLHQADVAVFVNRIALDEARRLGELPGNTIVWDVADLGEAGRIPSSEEQREAFSEDVYAEIVKEVDALVETLNLQIKA